MSYRINLDGTVDCDTLAEAMAYVRAVNAKTPAGYKPTHKRHKWGLGTETGPGGKHGQHAFPCETCGTLKSYNGRGQPVYKRHGGDWMRGDEWCDQTPADVVAAEPTGFEQTLKGVCADVVEAKRLGRGPKPYPLRDVLYACAMRVHAEASGRQFRPDGAPHYNTLFLRMGDQDMTEALVDLLYRTRGVAGTPRPWGKLKSKGEKAQGNERMLRTLIERVASMSGESR